MLAILVLVACSGSPAPTPPGVPAVRLMQGTAVPWIGETAVARVEVGPYAYTLASATIAATGSFSLELQDPLDDWLLTDLEACPEVPVVPANARATTADIILVDSHVGESLGFIEHSNRDDPGALPEAGDVAAGRIYADRAASVHGTCVDAEGIEGFLIKYALDLAQGWNFLTTTVTEVTDDALVLELRSGSLPSGLVWHFLSNEGPPPPQEEPFSSVPVPVAGGHSFRTISAGWAHTCGVTVDGATMCWGFNGNGQVGLDPASSEACTDGPCVRTPVEVLDAPSLTSLALGTSSQHACGVTAEGRAYCWGYGPALGDGSVEDSARPREVAGDLEFVALAVASDTTCGIDAAGGLACWGIVDPAFDGSAGTAVPATFASPVAFTELAIAWSDMGQHACGLDAAGAGWCWGNNYWGELGMGETGWGDGLRYSATPLAVVGGLTFAAIAVETSFGPATSYGLTTTGEPVYWGRLPIPGFEFTGSPLAVPTGDHGALATLDAGFGYACALDATGAAWCWGINHRGTLGDGTTDASLAPVRVAGELTFVELAVGGLHACGLTAEGAAYCWGEDRVGNLGRGEVTPSGSSGAAMVSHAVGGHPWLTPLPIEHR